MSKNWCHDIAEMHTKFGVNETVRTFDKEKLKAFIKFRLDFLQEELNETRAARDADDVVDGLIDLCVVAIGTLDALDVDAHTAWDRVHEANICKKVGIKPGRPNPLGLPDLIKPRKETDGWDWVAPSHEDNVGLLSKLTESKENQLEFNLDSCQTS